MKFTLPEKDSDIAMAILGCDVASRQKDVPRDVRLTLERSAHLLNECRAAMQAATEELAKAAKLRAGLMDSISKHDEIANAKNAEMERQVYNLKSLLATKTPSEPPKGRVSSDEVI